MTCIFTTKAPDANFSANVFAFGFAFVLLSLVTGTLPFFTQRVAILNNRYQHRDLAAKFLYLVHEKRVADTKKIYLDNFVKGFRGSPMSKALPLINEAKRVLFRMDKVFVKGDDLLASAGMIVLYFLLFRSAMSEGAVEGLERSIFEEFEQARAGNRDTAEKDLTKANYDLLEFDRLMQTPNDAYAIELRLRTLKKYVDAHS